MTMILQQLGVWLLGGSTVLTVPLETVDGSFGAAGSFQSLTLADPHPIFLMRTLVDDSSAYGGLVWMPGGTNVEHVSPDPRYEI